MKVSPVIDVLAEGAQAARIDLVHFHRGIPKILRCPPRYFFAGRFQPATACTSH
jgi:hypothetical protein